MELTQYPKINQLLDHIVKKIKEVLANDLVGIYLYGSATAGDFDPQLSDIDLLVVLNASLTIEKFDNLLLMHKEISSANPDWNDRIESVYINQNDLKHFRDKSFEIAEISPGEPFHRKNIGIEWLISWYTIRISGKTLIGKNIEDVIPYISKEDYQQAEKEQIVRWTKWIQEYNEQSSRGSVAYVILTACRAMYNYSHQDRASKKKAANWASQTFPQWALLIENAQKWRQVQWYPHQEVVGSDISKVVEFVNFAVDQIVNDKLM
jgi:predicted nucleotidyltransferase